jgi:hypothetical protein
VRPLYTLGHRCILTNFTSIDVAETFDDREKLWFGKMKEKAANLSMITIAYYSISFLFSGSGIGRYFPMSGFGGSDGTPRLGFCHSSAISHSRT